MRMKLSRILKDYTLLWAMVIGALLHPYLYHLSPLLPYNLFLMLLLSYTRIKPSDMKVEKSHIIMMVVQWLLGIICYLVIAPYNQLIALGVSLIVLTPTATAASVVTYMLGGSVAFVTTLLILSNIAIALFGPLLISWVNPDSGSTYFETVMKILAQVSLLLFLPLAIAWSLRFGMPKWHEKLAKRAGDTFYVWAFNVMIVSASAVHSFKENESFTVRDGILMGLVTFATTITLYFIGGRIAKWRGGNVVNGRQGFGQKNTIFAIWLAMTFLPEEVVLIPTFYIIWQNVINSLEISAHKNNASQEAEEL